MSTDKINTQLPLWSVEDLLQNDSFISAMTHPTKETEEYWCKAIEDGQVSIHDYKLARFFIDSVQVSHEKITHEEIFNLWEDIEVANKQNLKKGKRFLFFYTIVATGMVALVALLFTLYNIQADMSKDIQANNIENIKAPDLKVADIQLILSDSETLSLDGQEAEITYDEECIAISNDQTEIKKKQISDNVQTVYNQLIVPMGKRSMLTFADGSKIWVNAGTRVVYPSVFKKGGREIYVEGEAYLEVSPDKNNPFVVKTNRLDVEVLGTSFNIMAYEKDTLQSIVLVAGSVKVNMENMNETILSPNEMLTFSNGKRQVKHVNVEDYTSWRFGVYQFESESLGTITQRLARYYDQEIDCSKAASLLKCSGKLDLKDDISIVLNGIAKTAPIRCDYQDGRFIITNK